MQERPTIPESITVHLGAPDSDAPNVTVPFSYYIKNVASSEIYPTWPEEALRANILAIISYALNRVYTEWYRSKGYDFDITSITAVDQAFVQGRDIFENIGIIVDELFTSYIRRVGNIEPLFASFCNGTTSLCDGLSQWGTVELADQGLDALDILRYYYGNDIEIVSNVDVAPSVPSFPGITLSLDLTGNDVLDMQIKLNRISGSFPGVSKIPEADGYYGEETEAAVSSFQEIFNLPVTGEINEATWYKINYIYLSVKKLAELNSEGLVSDEIAEAYPEVIAIGQEGSVVRMVQYFLAVVGNYYQSVLPIEITGYFGEETADSIRSFQQTFGLPQTGELNEATWNDLYHAYLGIVESVPVQGTEPTLFPGTVLDEGDSGEYVTLIQEYLCFLHETYPEIPQVSRTGYFGPQTKASVAAFQRRFGLRETGIVGAETWNELTTAYSNLRYGYDKKPYQHPGYIITAE